MKYRHLTAIALTAVLTPAVQAARPIEEILVTAQKREQYIEEIPFSITAIGRVAIEERDITDIAAVGQMVPNLQVTHAPGGSSSAQIAIRGGVTINPALTWETTVGLYVDGVYIGKTQGSIVDAVNAAGSSVRNAGRARIRGFELEGSMQVGEAIAVAAGYGYLDPNYKKFLDCGGTLDVAANRAFPHAPDTEVGNYGLVNARLILSDVSLGKQTSMTASLWVMNPG